MLSLIESKIFQLYIIEVKYKGNLVNMNLFTFDDVMVDIHEFEGMDVSININVAVPRLTKLYSQYYETPLSSKSTVEDLRERVRVYLNDPDILLPSCDIWPTDNHAFYLYATETLHENNLYGAKLTLMRTSEIKEEMFEFMNNDSTIEQSRRLCLVVTETSEIMHFIRQDH